ncbi:MAG: TonB family protein [Gemmatimonadota bacterium]
MFAHLIASAPTHDAAARPTVISGLIHLGLITLGVLMTRGLVATAPHSVSAPSALYFAPAVSLPAGVASSSVPAPVAAVAPPLDIPLPPPARLDFTVPSVAIAANGSHFAAGTNDSGRVLSVTSVGDSHDAPWRADEVDQAVSDQRGPAPEYPRVLAQSGIAGEVTLQYIVGADGSVEAASIVVIGATRPEFGVAATEAIRRARFAPARRRGQPVRQLVRQLVRFSLASGR